jgi:hypothetical protein
MYKRQQKIYFRWKTNEDRVRYENKKKKERHHHHHHPPHHQYHKNQN